MKLLIAASIFTTLSALLYLPAGADDEDGVEILVTPKIIAINIAQSQLDYGSPEVGSTNNRPSPAFFTVENQSTVAVDLQIYGAGTVGFTSGTPGWSLSDTQGTDAFVHWYSLMSSPTYPNEFSKLQSSPEDIPGLAFGASTDISLALDMPTTTNTLEQQKAPVTIVALEGAP
jgi:hypothetical protein